MKTLDKVIEAQETCLRGACDKCPYDNSNFDICDVKLQSDVLYYLKNHKNTVEYYKEAIRRVTEVIDRYEKMVADYLSINNPPLTWEELKQMVEKPIWVEEKGMLSIWIIIGDVTENWLYSTDRNAYRHEEYGKIWNAYRKERA